MKNQSGTIKTNLELYRVVMGGSGGYRRLTGGSDDFSLQTNTQTLHHNIYIIIMSLPHWTFPQAHHYSCQAAELPPMGHKLGRPVIQSNCPHQVTVTRSISKTLSAMPQFTYRRVGTKCYYKHCKGFQRLPSVTLCLSRHLYKCKDTSSKMC